MIPVMDKSAPAISPNGEYIAVITPLGGEAPSVLLIFSLPQGILVFYHAAECWTPPRKRTVFTPKHSICWSSSGKFLVVTTGQQLRQDAVRTGYEWIVVFKF